MIKEFNDVKIYESGIIYQSVFEQIKKLHEKEPERAGELAISAIEMVLTGQISSDDYLLEIMLETSKVVSEKKRQQYEKKKEGKMAKQMEDYKLAEIAQMLNQGMKQSEIGRKLGLSQQIISYRVGVIKQKYPSLLQNAESSVKEDSPEGIAATKQAVAAFHF